MRDLSVVQQLRDSADRLPTALTIAVLYGKRVAAPSFCLASAAGGGTSIVFKPACLRKFAVFMTPRFQTSHVNCTAEFRRAAAGLGTRCQVTELDTEDNAKALGTQAMVVDSLADYSAFLKKLATVQRERGERGAFRSKT